MKFFALLIPLFCFLNAVSAEESIEDLAWLAGCWESKQTSQSVEEQWMRPSGNTMIGMSRTVANGQTVAYEFLRIVQSENGLEYISKPSGQEQASFRKIKMASGEVIFENRMHDFPQRIIYNLQEGGKLHARIEGTVDGRLRAVDFPMQRASCP